MPTFSVQTNQRFLSWDDLLATWEALDRQSGFRAAWLVDHLSTVFIPGQEPVDGPNVEPWTALAAPAHATTRLRLGLLVSSNCCDSAVAKVAGMPEPRVVPAPTVGRHVVERGVHDVHHASTHEPVGKRAVLGSIRLIEVDECEVVHQLAITHVQRVGPPRRSSRRTATSAPGGRRYKAPFARRLTVSSDTLEPRLITSNRSSSVGLSSTSRGVAMPSCVVTSRRRASRWPSPRRAPSPR